MTALAPTLQAFFTDRLCSQLQASPHTIASYRDSWRLLLGFVQQRTRKAPSQLDIDDLDHQIVATFLSWLETDRGNSVATRNVRLGAIRSLFQFAALRHPEHADTIQRVLAIPAKRHDQTEICFLIPDEIDALLAAPDRTTWLGRRDHALLLLAIQASLRLAELTTLRQRDLQLDSGPHVRCHGKGRRNRSTPLTDQTVAVLRAWCRELPDDPDTPLFPTRRGTHLSSDAVQWLLAKHVAAATSGCATLRSKRVTPHVLRHTAAMRLLHARVDITVIALWLGHQQVQTTMVYLHADLALKERALARTTPPDTAPGRYRPADPLLDFLNRL